MKMQLIVLCLIGFFISSCSIKQRNIEAHTVPISTQWDDTSLAIKASQHLDSSRWDRALYQQDVNTYRQFKEAFNSYPLNKSPFPVAEYDYAVSYVPITIEASNHQLNGIKIGECNDPNCDYVRTRLTLMVLTNSEEVEESTLIESRNYPYLTAQGMIKWAGNEFDWVFSATPDGYASLMINMKYFDLRFGETIIIYPQSNNAFYYDQIRDSPDRYQTLDQYKDAIAKVVK